MNKKDFEAELLNANTTEFEQIGDADSLFEALEIANDFVHDNCLDVRSRDVEAVVIKLRKFS